MFGLKGRDVFNKPKSNIDELFSKIYKKWHKIVPYIFGFLIITSIGTVSYAWYKYLYNRNVSKIEVDQYIITQNRDFVFNKERFDGLQNIIETRKERYNAEKLEYSDLFYRNDKTLEE